MSLYFEGPEKKLEIYSFESQFLSYSDSFWSQLVSSCGAEIIKSSETNDCKFFLLSESSLFVWNHKLLMITCGRTELISSAKFMLDKIGLKAFDHLFFQRKNEYFPEYQKSFVFDDFKNLKEMFPSGYGLRFGDKDDHHLNIFEYSSRATTPDEDVNLEVLLYGVDPLILDKFLNPTDVHKKYLSEILLSFFPDFKVDEHWFDPYGYSMNAVLKKNYGTIHVTPEKGQNYISIEINNIKREQVEVFLNKVDEKFKPKSCDMVYFDPSSTEALNIHMDNWVVRQSRFDVLKSGYGVSYCHWANKSIISEPAEQIQF